MLGETIAKMTALLYIVFTAVFVAFGQTKPSAVGSATEFDFPVLMRQNVIAGTTPVGTTIQAKLTVATLVNGTVIPEDAILSGEVTESVAKMPTSPCRLAIRIDSARWKNRSVPTVLAIKPKVYLTAWYYPAVPLTASDLSSGLPDAGNKMRVGNSTGLFPGERNPTGAPLDTRTTADKDSLPAAAPDVPKHRVVMKNVESIWDSNGTLTLSSKYSNIKLDKTTTYVFAAGPG
jgi:hypothetical protein